MARGTILGIPTGYLLVGLLVGAYFFVPSFASMVNDFWGSLTGLTPGSVVTTGGIYSGNVQFVFVIQDAVLGTVVNPTADAYNWYSDAPSALAGGTALTTTGHTLAADPSGDCWITFGDSSDYYFCSDLFESQNAAWVKAGSYWADLNDDNTPEFVAHIDTSKAGKTGQAQTPVINLVAPWLHEDSSITEDSPADKTATGGTEVVVPVTWAMSGITVGDGVFISRLYITVNNTIASGKTVPEECTLSGGWVGGGGKNDFTVPIKQIEGSTSYYYYIEGSPSYRDYYTGERFWYKVGEASTCYMTINFRCILGSDGYDSTVTLYYETVDGAGTLVNTSDAINIQL